jgi:uncharacterized protein (TIGR03067 family)
MRALAPCAVLAALAALAGGCAKKTDAGAGRGHDPASTSDLAHFQGDWAVDALDVGFPADAPEDEKRREYDRLKQGRYRFEGTQLTVAEPGRETRFTFALNETIYPKVMTVMQEGAEPRQWIYRFERGLLFLAKPEGGTGRPVEFNARPWVRARPGQPEVPGVTVLILTKADPGPGRPATAK